MKNKIILTTITIIILVIGGMYYFSRTQSASAVQTQKILDTSQVEQTHMETKNIEGLKIETLSEGTGEGAKNGQVVAVNYTGMLTDGTVFDSSIPRKQVFPVQLGSGQVIQGWELGLLGIKVGEKRRLTIAPELAYGQGGIPGVIPPSATLIFEISCEAIQ